MRISAIVALCDCLRVGKRSQLREHHSQIKTTRASAAGVRDYDEEMKTKEMKVSLGHGVPTRGDVPGPIRVVS